MKHRTFTSADQIAFAELSGDNNPLHIDPIAARRLLFGSPVVHGIHALLWGLDCYLENKAEGLELRSINAVFSKPIKVGEAVSLSLENDDDSYLTLELLSGGFVGATIKVDLDKCEQRNFENLDTSFPEQIPPCVLSDDEIEKSSGTLNLCLNDEAAAKLFPHLVRCVSRMQIAVILSTTRLVGVRCPGLHSVYSELDLSTSISNETTEMQYEVTKFDKRFSLVTMNVVAPEMAGTIRAFRRPAPKHQPSFLTLKNQVDSQEFRSQRALIIGGSRGLGEVAAKLLSAGGADVKITYHQGKEDADRIVDDIVSNGGVADGFRFDVLSPKQDSLKDSLNDWVPTHLYYFATPYIAPGKGELSVDLFNNFCDYYVAGFFNTLKQVTDFESKHIFYPSTVFIDESPKNMGEYAAAKIAGEMLCTSLEKYNQQMTIHKPRLPMVATDQTASIMPVSSQDPLEIMIKELRFLRDSSID